MSVSGLEDLYREIVLDHYRSPRNRGTLPTPPAHAVEAFNPLCGDEVTLYLQIDGGRLADIKTSGQGCSISQSAASLMSAAVKGRTLEEINSLIAGFKAMMSIHEASLSSDVGAGEGDGTGGDGDRTEGDGGGGGRDAGAGPGESAGGAEDTAIANSRSGAGGGADGTATPRGERSGEGNAPPSGGDRSLMDLDSLGELAALQGVVRFPVRIKCAVLSWNALAQGIEEIRQSS